MDIQKINRRNTRNQLYRNLKKEFITLVYQTKYKMITFKPGVVKFLAKQKAMNISSEVRKNEL